MFKKSALSTVHQSGDASQAITEGEPSVVDTLGGKVFVRWDPDANVTGFGPVAYFIEFLKTNGLWESWVQDCPLRYRSANAPPQARHSGHPDAFGIGRAQAVCAHQHGTQ